MTQREVTDTNGTTWTCVQAYGANNSKSPKEVAQKTAGSDEQLPVVCTPDGGAQSVRLHLPLNWMEQLSEEELLSRIQAALKE